MTESTIPSVHTFKHRTHESFTHHAGSPPPSITRYNRAGTIACPYCKLQVSLFVLNLSEKKILGQCSTCKARWMTRQLDDYLYETHIVSHNYTAFSSALVEVPDYDPFSLKPKAYQPADVYEDERSFSDTLDPNETTPLFTPGRKSKKERREATKDKAHQVTVPRVSVTRTPQVKAEGDWEFLVSVVRHSGTTTEFNLTGEKVSTRKKVRKILRDTYDTSITEAEVSEDQIAMKVFVSAIEGR